MFKLKSSEADEEHPAGEYMVVEYISGELNVDDILCVHLSTGFICGFGPATIVEQIGGNMTTYNLNCLVAPKQI